MMTPRNVFTITAFLLIPFGACFVLIPNILFPIYGVNLGDGGYMLSRVAGAAVAALGTLAFLGRGVDEPSAMRVVQLALFCFFVIKSIVTLIAQLQGVFNVLGWSILAIDIPLAVAYAYLLFLQPRAVKETA